MKRRVPVSGIALAVLVTTLAACPMRAEKRPELTVRVVDELGRPVPGARVVLVAGENPHHRVLGVDERVAGADGAVSWTQEIEMVTGCLCIPHGVGARYFSVCADAPGRAHATASDVHGKELVLTLKPGTSRCDTNPATVGIWRSPGEPGGSVDPERPAAPRTAPEGGP